MEPTLHRSALGRAGHLGAIYDCRTDTFQADNIFTSKITKDMDAVYRDDMGGTTVELLQSNSLEDKFSKLNIEAELSVSVLGNMISLSGHAKFLDEKVTSAKSSSMSLLYQTTTCHEEIVIRQMKSLVNHDVLSQSEGTHILTGIDWGAVCTVTAEFEFEDADEKRHIEGGLKAELQKIKGVVDLKGGANAESAETLKQKSDKFKFYSKCDVGNDNQDLPVTLDEALDRAKTLPSLLAKTNDGKGVPLKFVFTPINTVKKWFQTESKVHTVYKTIDSQTLQTVVSTSQNMTLVQQKLSDIKDLVLKWRHCVPDKDIEKITKKLSDFNAEEAGFRDKLQVLLREVRSGNKEVSELCSLTRQLEEGEFSPTQIDAFLTKWDKTHQKIAAIKKLQLEGIEYFGKDSTIDVTEFEEAYMWTTNDFLEPSETKTFFHGIKKSVPEAKMCIRDMAVKQTEATEKISHYRNGEEISSDVLADFGHGSIIQFSEEGKFCDEIPLNRAKVELICPKETCSRKREEWKCLTCKDTIWYGIKTKKFYCMSCQKEFDPEKGRYRCSDLKHGSSPSDYNSERLWSQVNQLRESKKKNILILGETGVGKSTFINALANYLYFPTLEEAVEGNKETPIVAIPTSFTITDRQGIQSKINFGTPDPVNEVHSDKGGSNTQHSRSYPFSIGEYVVNLIDTPGIGDTRGTEQDKKNMDDLLNRITYYDEIHAILILLKPNNARLGIAFKYCIQQLLAHLHKDTARMISFIFTNARSTNYMGGDTLIPLKPLVEELGIECTQHNTFYFDNEAFRYLAIVLQSPDLDQNFPMNKLSWEKSVDECNKLFKHIEKLKPHPVRDTTTLNDARRIILELSSPLQKFAKTIAENVKELEDYQVRISEYEQDESSLEKDLSFQGFDLVRDPKDNPRTVCTAPSCTTNEASEYGQGHREPVYNICDPYCGVWSEKLENGQKHKSPSYENLGAIDADVLGAAKLKECWAMQKGTDYCGRCGHHYSTHMHKTYELRKVPKTFVNPQVQKKVNTLAEKKKQCKEAKEEASMKIKELKHEQDIVRDAAAYFSVFLKQFAIIPYNDAMGEYLEQEIQAEKGKRLQDAEKIAKLEEAKGKYEEMKDVITKEMALADSAKAIVCVQQIKSKKEEVCRLKNFGESMKNIFDGIENAKRDTKLSVSRVPVSAPQKAKATQKWYRRWLSS